MLSRRYGALVVRSLATARMCATVTGDVLTTPPMPPPQGIDPAMYMLAGTQGCAISGRTIWVPSLNV
jgi:hypothetical protein